MPRGPLRRRQLNHNRPVPRVANRAVVNNAARAELERKLASKPVGQRPTDSDDSDRLVVKGDGRRGRNVVKQEIYATGAVAEGDQPGAYPTRAQRRRSLNRDTKEVLAQRHGETREDVASADHVSMPAKHRTSLLVNGTMNTSTSEGQPKGQTAAAVASAIKAPGSILRPTQPTPSRETSILGTLKPRRRQPSILQNIDHDSSSFDLDDEEQFLPDAESTPFNLSKSRSLHSTPATTSTQSSIPRKRKLGQSDPMHALEDQGQQQTRSPLATMHRRSTTPESTLPAIPVSTLRESGRKQRERITDENDVMAPPQSSSSPAPSTTESKPIIPPKKARKKAQVKPVRLMTTEELQAVMMPAKRRRTARERTLIKATEFDIPADSDSPTHELDHDSSFLPTKKGRKSTKRTETASNSRVKPGNGELGQATVAGKQKGAISLNAKLKPSTRNLITTTITTSAPILSPSTSRRNRETKSPSQLSSTVASTTRSTRASMKTTTTESVSTSAAPSGKRYGGSSNLHIAAHLADKENAPSGLDPSQEETFEDGYDEDGGVDGAIQRYVDSPAKQAVTGRNKWADIDAWDMDFEEVEVMTPSGSGGSSPMKR
ncbi:uncharacterized protein A1O9_00984 [Exophiala aquamarina CBS 119918]|uniref:Uncharacterized protein n=1 Tax=Exophiala aquamarina CBS 119918 TaxID=1182545 RepID=A0A072PSC5_9EURO|nr:uncharacterized protein A1O9_00984 [Exophiala aquamarina CBS 119918]KEF63009.1 hypothetical protein A1O9_00984 [Exophiala aquamarina CBS 119918]